MGCDEKRKMISPSHPSLSIERQCELLSLSRSGFYYSPVAMSEENLTLMARLDELYLENPEYGSRNMRDVLRREGKRVNRKRVQRLMRLMGLEAIYPKRNLSKPGTGSEHKVYPYLLKGLTIDHPNQVWATDITYIRLAHGFVYLVAIIDWYSRKILSWELSTTMDQAFCIATLERALRLYGQPEIFNSDQGSQFTGFAFRSVLEDKGIRISMDGKGRAFDNIVIERFWRTLKYADIYLREYESPIAAAEGISRYIEKYNGRRPHDSLGNRTPDEVYLTESIISGSELENQREVS